MNWLERVFKRTAKPSVTIVSSSAPDDFADVTDAPGWSLWALKRRQEAVGQDLRANVYAYDGRTFLITSITHHTWFTETGVPTVLPIDASNEDLGCAICEHLLAYRLSEHIDARNSKPSDWPVFQASGAKSIKGFERKSHFISLSTPFQSVEMKATPRLRVNDDICVHGSAPPVHEDIGAMVRKVLKGVDALREKGLL